MDLAKIRKKALQEQAEQQPEVASSFTREASETADTPAAESVQSQLIDDCLIQNHSPVTYTKPAVIPPVDVHAQIPVNRHQLRDPLEVILSGREAAGCDDDQSLLSAEKAIATDKEYLEYLCFRVSDEIYGINIMDIKEIIKPREVTEVPRAPSFVSGIISLRGIIIPIIDMLDRLGLPRETVTGRERVIVVRHGNSFSGLLVDEIIQVVHIAKDCLEAAPAVLEGIDRDFVSGIGRADGRMIILLNLENVADIHLY
jgi:purine-binding chemotaxis protein CheW